MTRFRLARTPLAAALALALPAAAAWAQGTGNGLYGEYYNNGSWSGTPGEIRVGDGPVPVVNLNPSYPPGENPGINFFYPSNLAYSPNETDDTTGSDAGGGPRGGIFGTQTVDNFSTIWRGELEIPVTGNYRFQLRSDDQGRFYFNGSRILSLSVTTQTSGTYALTAGQRFPVVVMHQEYGGGAYVNLRWEYVGNPTGTGFQPIPRRWFYSPTAPAIIPTPTFSPNGGLGSTPVTISIAPPDANVQIRYTTNGTDPGIVLGENANAQIYTGPVTMGQYGLLRARAYVISGPNQGLVSGLGVSAVYSANFPALATPPAGVVPGVYSRYYDLPGLSFLPVFDNLIPQIRGLNNTPPNPISVLFPSSMNARPKYDQFGFVFTGYINIPGTGFGGWTFTTESDDGSRLYIDGQEVVNNDGLHGPTPGVSGGPIQLEAGYHTIRVEQFENGGGEAIRVFWQGPGVAYAQIPLSALFTEPLPATPVISPPGGQFADSRLVTLTCATPGAILFWTTDGSFPNPFNPINHQGSGPSGVSFTITRDTTLRVLATAPFRNPSQISKAVFFRSPLLLSATATSVANTEVLVTFDKAVDPTSGTLAANYSLSGGPTVSSAALVAKPGALRAHWKLDEPGLMDNAADSSGNGNTGVVPSTGSWFLPMSDSGAGSTAPLLGVANPFSREYIFFDDGIEVPDSPTLDFGFSSFTIALWMRPSTATDMRRIINKWDGTAGWVLDINNPGDNILRFYIDDGPSGVDIRVPADILGNVWQHVAVRVDRLQSRVTIFRDGLRVGSGDMSANFGAADNAAKLFIGMLEPPASGVGTFSGNLDDIRIYGVGLSDGEILGLANGGDQVTNMVRLTTSALGANHTLSVQNVRALGTGTLGISPLQSAAFAVVPAGTMLQENYTGIGGSSMTDLTRNALFSAGSSSVQSRSSLASVDPGGAVDTNDYGVRMRGYFIAPSTSNFKFAIATDDHGQFWISPNEDPANKVLVSRVLGWTGSLIYVNTSVTQSVPIPLVSGQKYYVEALMKEGGGGDNLAVAAKVDDGSAIANSTAPIAGAQLVLMRDPIVITRHPQGRVTSLNQTVSFDVVVSGTGPLTYQWFKDGNPVPNAAPFTGIATRQLGITPTTAVENGNYFVRVSNGIQTLDSDVAPLVVHNATAGPTFTTFTPSSGSAAGGQPITITGTNFMTGATGVAFGTTPATTVTVDSDTQLTVIVPAGPVGSVPLLISTPLGYVSTGLMTYTYVSPPTLTQVNPNFGVTAGGNTVTLTGTNFNMTPGNTTVTFGGTLGTSVNVTSTTSLTVQVPMGAGPGSVNVVVLVLGINSAPLVNGYTYFDLPTVTNVNPNAGNEAGGNTVTITGTSFVVGQTTVTFGGTPGINPTVTSATTLTVQVPPGSGLNDPVVVTNPAGASTVNGSYSYYPTPTLATVVANQGPDQGGTNVLLTGTGFVNGLTSVSFGGGAGGNVNVTSETTLTVDTPSGSGIVNVVVTTPGGPSVQTVSFTYHADPTVSLISPNGGPVAGGTVVTITGANFVPGNTQVLFGAVAGTLVNVNGAGTSLTVTSPAQAAGTVAVTVNTPGGSFPTAAAFTYFNLPDAVSIAPPGGPTVGGTPFTITGTNLAGTTGVTFGGTAATGLTSNATTITGTTPAHVAGTVDVVVTTPGGQDTLAGAYSYAVAPTVTSVVPNAGPTVGGNTVTINGANFNTTPGATTVLFGANPGTSVNVTNTTTLTVVVPNGGAAGAVNVSVTVAGLTGTLVNGYTYWDPPTLTNLSSSAGNIAGGNVLTLTGTNFATGISVSFGGTAGTGIIVGSPTSLTVTVPAHAAGAVNVTVTTPGGTSPQTNTYTYFGTPTLTNVAPSAGFDQGGQVVTLTGTNFTGATAVNFGANPGTGIAVNGPGTSLDVTTPAGSGTVNVSVVTPGGTSAQVVTFTYHADPTITLINPVNGPVAAGTAVTITGTNFLSGNTTVTFGGTPGTAVVVTGTTSLSVAAPAHAAGAVDVVVTTPGGSATSAGGYTYHAAPTITNIAPGNGPTNGGTAFTITGTNFPTGLTTVTFGGVGATGVAATLTTTINGNTPQRPAGTVVVRVTTPGGFVDTSYDFDAGPFISTVTPNAGSTIGGNTVTLGGSGFTGATLVTFGGTAGTGLNVVSAVSATVVAPAHAAGAVDVVITTPAGSFTLVGGYSFVTTPTITNLNPADGPTAGGNTVTITGTSFLAGGTTVLFGTNAGTAVNVLSPTSLTVTAPAGTGTVGVTVTTIIGTSPPSNYVYHAPPTLATVAPNSGLDQGGQTVTLTGTNFATGLTTVSFGGAAGTTVIVTGPTTLTVMTPAGTGVVNVTVTTPGGTTGSQTFTYYADPTITLINPANGPIAGANVVTITGTNFVAGSTSVTFGGTAGTAVSVSSLTSLTVTAPAHAAGAVTVVVTTPGGTANSVGGYTYHAAPTITNINPIQGPLVAGTAFTITGTNLPAGNTTVTFAGVAATGVVATVTQVTGAAPAGGAGAATVRVTTPGGFVDTTYTYVPAPTITSITPSRGSSAGGQSVTIVGGNFVAGATEVRLGGVLATAVNVTSGSTLTCSTPAHAPGLVDLAVTTFNPPGQTTTALSFYTYVDAATSVDLSLLFTVDDGIPNVGQDVTLVATLSNTGAVAGTGVTVNVSLPAGLSVLSALPSAGSYAAGLWNVGGIGVASSSTLTITATVTSAAAMTAVVEVAAVGQQDLDSIPGNGATNEDDRATVSIDAGFTITSASPLPGATSGAFYSQTIVATGGAVPYAWSMLGSTPAFPFALNPATGVISGTAPVVAGPTTYNFTIGATDAGSAGTSKAFAITVSPSISATATVNALPAPLAGTVGIPYSHTFTAVDATPPYTWSTPGPLPNGLSLNALTGTLAGTPTAANTFNFTVTATPAAGNADSQAFSITIVPNPMAFVTPPALPGAALTSPYQQTLEIQGGIGGFTWAVIGTPLPTGLTLTGSGRTASLAGTPTAPAGSYAFTIRVTDNNAGQAGLNVSRTFLLDIAAAGSTFTVNSATLPPATINIAYTATLTSAGGTGPVTWSVVGGVLPAGLTLAPATGVISGTPTEAGVFAITVQGTDAAAASDTADLVVDVAPAPLITTGSPLPGGILNTAYFTQLVASGGTPPLAWTVTAGSFPGGLNLSAVSGAISGSPNSAVAFNFTVTVTDARGATDTQVYDLTVVNPGATLAVVATLPPGVAGVPYNATMLAVNVAPPVTWLVTVGTLPAWATLDPATGTVTGVPTAGTTTLTVQPDDATATVATATFDLVIVSGLSVATLSLPGADPGIPYTTTLASSGGTAPVVWTLSSGSLPGGFTLSPTGVISGTTGSTGFFTIRVQATDALGATASRLLTLLVAPGASIGNSGSSGKNCSMAAAEPGTSTSFPALAALLLLGALALRKRN